MTGCGSGGLESRAHIRAASLRRAQIPKLKSFNVVGVRFKPQPHLEVHVCRVLFATAWSQPSSTAQIVSHGTDSFLPGAQLGCCCIGFQDGSEVTGSLCRVLSSAHPHLSCLHSRALGWGCTHLRSSREIGALSGQHCPQRALTSLIESRSEF